MTYTITVRRIGTDEIAHREEYDGTQQEAERRASNIWSYHRFDSQPGIFRLKVFEKGQRSALMTIG